MIIAIDLDGVTLDSISSWLEQYHPEYTPEDIQEWNAWRWVDGCDSEAQFFAEFNIQDPNKVKLIDGAREVILCLEKEHTIYFLTSKSKECEEWSRQVLNREGLGHIPLVNSYLERKKKSDYEYDILVDDSPNHSHIDRCIMFTQPWNNSIQTTQRVSTWKEFKEVVDKLENIFSFEDI
jgi:5'(3')-deoxyribonucleotidase